jgi:HTH-type transcriptional repressor of NAD biosynthesis genes
MVRGLILGKFLPLHAGHVALIEFGSNNCDELIVLICANDAELIDGDTRLYWIEQTFKDPDKVKPVLLRYDDRLLPNTSESSRDVSKLWADHIRSLVAPVDIVFSSEPYGEFMAEYLGCDFKVFDRDRIAFPVSATLIRNAPFEYWDHIPPAVRPSYVKKICLCGTESTGKTTLTQKLAAHYHTTCVIEMAREILEKTIECIEEHLQAIAKLHAETINAKILQANKMLFVDTDVNITRSYSRFLFDKELEVPAWIDEANRFDLYLYLDNDVPFVQDGTRLDIAQRDLLDKSHKAELTKRGINYALINGSWDERFLQATTIIDITLSEPTASPLSTPAPPISRPAFRDKRRICF